jgi:hypothetical protein
MSRRPCPSCSDYIRPVLITPTHVKDYRPYISQTSLEHLKPEQITVVDHGSLPLEQHEVGRR